MQLQHVRLTLNPSSRISTWIWVMRSCYSQTNLTIPKITSSDKLVIGEGVACF